MQAEEAMTRDVVTVAPGATLAEAEELMRHGRFRHLPVVEDGRVLGVVSEREVRAPAAVTPELAETLSGRPVRAVMRAPVISVAPEDPVEQAATMLDKNKIGCLPVLRRGALVGIITTSDVFHAYVHSAGITEPSTRVEVRAPDLPAALAGIAATAQETHTAIAGLVTERDGATGVQRVVVRFATLQGPRLIAALRARGLDIAGPDPAAEAAP